MKSFEAATSVIDAAIEAQQGPLPPTFVVEFLLGPWRAYLATVHRDQGETSAAWSEAAEGTNLLLWSVAPKLSAEDKQALTASLSRLLPIIRQVMDAAGWQQAERSAFLAELGRCHLCLIKTGWDFAGDAAKTARPPTVDSQIDLTDTVRLDPDDPRFREYLDALNEVQVEQIEIAAPRPPLANGSTKKVKR